MPILAFMQTNGLGNSNWMMTCIRSRASSRNGEHLNALYFKVRATNGKRYLLRWHEQSDEWFLQSDYDGRELFDRRSVQIIAVDSVAIREAESRIAGCEACRADQAALPFDWILADVLSKRGPYN